MKISLFASAALVAALCAAPALAQTTGYVGGAWSSLDDSWDGDKEGLWTIEGAVASELQAGWTVQFDGRQSDLDHGDHGHNFGAAIAHVYNRDSGHALGAYGGLIGNDGNPLWTVGAEGALYFSNLTLSGELGYAKDHEDSCCDTSGWTARASAKLFLSDRTAVEAGLAYDDFDDGASGWVGALGVEHQFDNPLSVFAGYRHSEWDYDFGGSHDVDSFSIGLRWNFGTADLKARDREGASMQGGAGVARDLADLY